MHAIGVFEDLADLAEQCVQAHKTGESLDSARIAVGECVSRQLKEAESTSEAARLALTKLRNLRVAADKEIAERVNKHSSLLSGNKTSTQTQQYLEDYMER